MIEAEIRKIKTEGKIQTHKAVTEIPLPKLNTSLEILMIEAEIRIIKTEGKIQTHKAVTEIPLYQMFLRL